MFSRISSDVVITSETLYRVGGTAAPLFFSSEFFWLVVWSQFGGNGVLDKRSQPWFDSSAAGCYQGSCIVLSYWLRFSHCLLVFFFFSPTFYIMTPCSSGRVLSKRTDWFWKPILKIIENTVTWSPAWTVDYLLLTHWKLDPHFFVSFACLQPGFVVFIYRRLWAIVTLHVDSCVQTEGCDPLRHSVIKTSGLSAIFERCTLGGKKLKNITLYLLNSLKRQAIPSGPFVCLFVCSAAPDVTKTIKKHNMWI